MMKRGPWTLLGVALLALLVASVAFAQESPWEARARMQTGGPAPARAAGGGWGMVPWTPGWGGGLGSTGLGAETGGWGATVAGGGYGGWGAVFAGPVAATGGGWGAVSATWAQAGWGSGLAGMAPVPTGGGWGGSMGGWAVGIASPFEASVSGQAPAPAWTTGWGAVPGGAAEVVSPWEGRAGGPVGAPAAFAGNGLIIDASATNARRCMSPKVVVAGTNTVVYGNIPGIDSSVVIEYGIAAWASTLAEAKAGGRAGRNPLIVTATGGAGSTVEISARDAQKIQEANRDQGFLEAMAVTIVVK